MVGWVPEIKAALCGRNPDCLNLEVYQVTQILMDMGLDQLLKHLFFWVSPKLKILEDLFRSCSSFTFNAGTRQIEDMTLVFTVHVFTLALEE